MENPLLQLEDWSVSRLRDYERNPRKNDHAVERMAATIKEFGFLVPVLAKSDGLVVDGHLRLKGARKLGLTSVPVVLVDHLTPAQVQALRIAINKSAEWAEWDDALLRVELSELTDAGFDMTLTGFDEAELDALFAPPEADEQSAPPDPNAGALLERVNITVAEPRHIVQRGDRYLLAGRHHLFCLSVLRDWPQWAPLLTEGAIFCPYPGPFVPYGKTAEDHTLVMVQSDPYVAGHLLDRYEECYGPGSIAKADGVPHVVRAAA